MSETGRNLRDNNDKIVKLMALLKQQKNEIDFLIKKQEIEKEEIRNEIERLTFKLSLLTKSLNQRIIARDNYEKALQAVQANYYTIVEESEKLLSNVSHEVMQLEQIMDKKTETNENTKIDISPEKGQKVLATDDSSSAANVKPPEPKSKSFNGQKHLKQSIPNSKQVVDRSVRDEISSNSTAETEIATDDIQSYRDDYGRQHGNDMISSKNGNKFMNQTQRGVNTKSLQKSDMV